MSKTAAGATVSTYSNPDHAGFMHSQEDDIWYRIGYALERVRRAPGSLPALETLLAAGGASGDRSSARSSGEPSGGRSSERSRREAPGDNPGHGSRSRPASGARDALVQALAAGGARSLAGRLLRIWSPRERVGIVKLMTAGASGAAAALLTELVTPLTRPGSGETPGGEELALSVLEGVGRGLTYGGVVEPRLPGPAYLLGFVYGTAEYVAASWGGLPSLLRSASPHGKIPYLSGLLEPSEDEDRIYLEYVVFGLTLALLYDAVREKRGIDEE